jgi:arylsulfatase A-like enzyme
MRFGLTRILLGIVAIGLLSLALLEVRLSGPTGMSVYIVYRAVREFVRDAVVPTPPSIAGLSNTGPNVVVIVLDCFRFDYVRNASPHLREFAKTGWQHDRYYSAAPWTKPSTTSLFTGLPVRKHYVMKGGGEQLPQEAVTLAEIMQAAGFRTAGFVWNPHLTRRQAFDQGFDHYVDRTQRGSKRLIQEFFSWLDNERPERFFAYIHFQGTHDPYYDDNLLGALLTAPAYDGDVDFSDVDYKRAVWEGELELTPEHAAHLKHVAEGKAARVDREAVQGFLDRFDASELPANTMLIITSDHGDAFYEHQAVSHGKTIFDEEIHVPLFVRYPAEFAESRGFARVGRDSCPASTLDILPTVVDFVGLSKPPHVDGRSLIPGADAGDTCSHSVISEMTMKPSGIAGAAIVSDDDKLIVDYREDAATQLFDVSADPGETENLAAREAQRADALARELADRLNDDGSSMAEWDRVEGVLTEQQREELRALGYLDD